MENTFRGNSLDQSVCALHSLAFQETQSKSPDREKVIKVFKNCMQL